MFAYLDAHWYENLPLDNELKTLASFKNVIILIDDFMVPNNSSWKHDSYGSTNLNLESVDIQNPFPFFSIYSLEKMQEWVLVVFGWQKVNCQ